MLTEYKSSFTVNPHPYSDNRILSKETTEGWRNRRSSLTAYLPVSLSHSKLGHFTVHSLPLTSDEIRSVKMSADEMR